MGLWYVPSLAPALMAFMAASQCSIGLPNASNALNTSKDKRRDLGCTDLPWRHHQIKRKYSHLNSEACAELVANVTVRPARVQQILLDRAERSFQLSNVVPVKT